MGALNVIRYSLAGLCITFLVSCTTTSGSFCAIAEAQRPSPATIGQMTDAEVEKALAALEKGRKLCGWRP